jgi:hypothetical protein
MNLYILNDVLYDYTSGMAVIAAESMEQCNQIFIEKFGSDCDAEWAKMKNKRIQEDFNTADVKVLENVNVGGVGVISYVYGGG